jgi:hypothetical protein
MVLSTKIRAAEAENASRQRAALVGRSRGRLCEKLAADLPAPVPIVPPDGISPDICPGLRDLNPLAQPRS